MRSQHAHLLAVALVAAPLAACQPLARPAPQQAPVSSTRIERGEALKTGVVTYDEFFSSALELERELATVRESRASAYKKIREALGAGAPADDARLIDEVAARADALRAGGASVVVVGEQAAVSGKQADAARPLSQAVSGALTAEKSARERSAKMPARASSMLDLAPMLEGSIDRDIADPKARADVKAEIAGARRLLAKLTDEARSLAEQAAQHRDELTAAWKGRGKPTKR